MSKLSKAERTGLLHELLDRHKGRQVSRLDAAVGDYTGRGDKILGHLFDKQREFAKDQSKRKSACCSRRAGKTIAVAAMCGQYAENYPRGLVIYMVTTRGHAKKLMWPELKRLDKRYALGWRFNNAELFVTTKSGSMICLAGADKEDEIEKFRGLAPVFVAIDESASFKPYITNLIEEVLEPALEDYSAPLVLVGTPGRHPSGFFYEATESNERESEWSRHAWTQLDNSMYPLWVDDPQWQTKARSWLQAVMVRKKWTVETPKFRREYLGQWCRDESRMLYKYSAERNLVHRLPDRAWRFLMGIDIGYSGTAFVVWAYAADDPYAYVVWAEKHAKLTLTQAGKLGLQLERQFKPMKAKVFDAGGLGGTIGRHWQERMGFSCIPAEKKKKMDFIEMMNDDLQSGAIKVLMKTGGSLVKEWEKLQTDESGEELRSQDNHCADAALYAWRRCRHYIQAPKGDPKPGDPDYEEWREERMWLQQERKGESVWEDKPSERGGNTELSAVMSENWGDLG